MAETFRFHLQDHGVKPMIDMLVIHHPEVVARSLNRVVLDIRKAEAKMVAQSFDFWSAVTRQFLANERSFPFEMASRRKLEAKVFAGSGAARSGSRDIFTKQEEGFTLKPGEGKQLELGKNPAAYAQPTEDKAAHLRSPRGRVAPSRSPAALLKGTTQLGRIKVRRRRRRKQGVGNLGTHVFISPNRKAILEVTPGGGRRFLYGLYQRSIPVRQHIHFFDTAARVVGAEMINKLLAEWDKVYGRFR